MFDPNGKEIKPALHVLITREMFGTFFTLTLDNEHTEELDADETREWFRTHGADMDVIDKALDQAWNFMRADVEIQNPKEPSTPKVPYAPDI